MTTTDQNETLIERTLSNLAGAWREIALSAARTVGRNGGHVDALRAGAEPEALKTFMTECLEARGGEVSARMRAAELGETYLELDATGRRRFLEVLAEEFAVDEATLEAACHNDAQMTLRIPSEATLEALGDEDAMLRVQCVIRLAEKYELSPLSPWPTDTLRHPPPHRLQRSGEGRRRT